MPTAPQIPHHPPFGLPHPATRPSREEVNSAIEAGLTPIIVQGDQMVAIGNLARIPRMIGDYRYALRTRIAGMDWEEAGRRCREARANQEQHKGNLLLWGYKALCEERDAAAEFVAMASDFREARSAVSELVSGLRQDGRIMDDVPLPVAFKANIEHCERHAKTFQIAFQLRKPRAADLLREWCGIGLAALVAKGLLVANPDGHNSGYRLQQMALSDLGSLEQLFAVSAELAAGIEKHGITGVIRHQRQGSRGRLPNLLDAWLVQQGRIDAPKIGPQKLARLLAKHGLADAPIDLMTRRLNESAAAHREPVPLLTR